MDSNISKPSFENPCSKDNLTVLFLGHIKYPNEPDNWYLVETYGDDNYMVGNRPGVLKAIRIRSKYYQNIDWGPKSISITQKTSEGERILPFKKMKDRNGFAGFYLYTEKMDLVNYEEPLVLKVKYEDIECERKIVFVDPKGQ